MAAVMAVVEVTEVKANADEWFGVSKKVEQQSLQPYFPIIRSHQ